jgi:hypothetical protein
MLEPCLEQVIEIRVNRRIEFKAKEQGLSRCEGYMYRRKVSAKPDRALGSLKERAFQKKAEHARNI